MRFPGLLALCLGLGLPAHGDPVEPPRGSALRAELLDTIRRDVEPRFGGPVEFVVGTLLVQDRRAIANLTAQRPGGAPIDLSAIPLVPVEGSPRDLIDGPTVQAYLYRPGTYGRSWNIPSVPRMRGGGAGIAATTGISAPNRCAERPVKSARRVGG